MTLPFPEYSEIQQAIETLASTMYPSEVHGVLCGLLCTKDSATAQDWVYRTFQEYDHNNLLQGEAVNQLTTLISMTLQQLNDPTFDFHLLLPDDETETGKRVQALGDWCQGFLTGLSMGGIRELKKLPANAVEIATDMAEIARAGSSYELTGGEEDEAAYQELVEYIRVGVLLINEELQPETPPANPDPMLH